MLHVRIRAGRDPQPELIGCWLDAHLAGPAVIIHGGRREIDEAPVSAMLGVRHQGCDNDAPKLGRLAYRLAAVPRAGVPT